VSRKTKKTAEPIVMAKPFSLMPPRPGACQVCATTHDPAFPHNRDSLYYQTAFKLKHNRYPTWADAMAHCTEEMKAEWTLHLTAHELMGDE